MTKKRITSQRVAERAGVSRTTVSLVLNNVASANISEETRRRVLKAARDLNYVPDVSARALASGRSNNIGLILFHPHTHVFVNTYIPSVIAGLTQVAQQHGFRILIEIIEDVHAEDAYMRLMRGREIAGMVLSNPRADDAEITTLAENGFPIVSLDYLNDMVCSVSADDLGGVRKCVAHLARLGHKLASMKTYAFYIRSKNGAIQCWLVPLACMPPFPSVMKPSTLALMLPKMLILVSTSMSRNLNLTNTLRFTNMACVW